MITVYCPKADCGKEYKVPKKSIQGKCTCKECGTTFTLLNPIAQNSDLSSSGELIVEDLATGSQLQKDHKEFNKDKTDRLSESSVSTTSISSASSPRGELSGTKSNANPLFETSAGPAKLGRFEIQQELGSGAFGTVYKAHDPKLNRFVAIKIPRSGNLVNEEDAQRFLREARAAGQLKHHYIVGVHEAGKVDGTLFIVSEFIHGQTLEQLCRSTQTISINQTIDLIKKLAIGLQYAHSHQIVHRDIKPANIMIDPLGDPHILDFGLAKRVEGARLQTREGVKLGTPAYMSPEQYAGKSHEADARSDLWSVGVMFYELLTGQSPFQGENFMQMAYAVKHNTPTPPSSINPAVSGDVDAICMKCLEKHPNARYASSQQLVDDLALVTRGQGLSWGETGPLDQLLHFVRYRPKAIAIAVSSALLMLILFVIIINGIFTAPRSTVATVNDIDESQNASEVNTHTSPTPPFKPPGEPVPKNESWSSVLSQHSKTRAENEQSQAIDNGSAAKLPVVTDSEVDEYVFYIKQAAAAIKSGLPQKALDHLSRCPEKMRHFEWHLLKKTAHSTKNNSNSSWLVGLRELSQPFFRKVVPHPFDADAIPDHIKTANIHVTTEDIAKIELDSKNQTFRIIELSDDGSRMVTVDKNNALEIWNTTTGLKELGLNKLDEAITGCAFRPRSSELGVVTVDGKLIIFDSSSGNILRSQTLDVSSLADLAYDKAGEALAINSYNRNGDLVSETVLILDASTGELLHTLKYQHGIFPMGSRFSGQGSGGQRLLTIDHEGVIRVFDEQTNQLIQQFPPRPKPVVCFAFDREGELGDHLITVESDGVVSIFDVQSGKPLASGESKVVEPTDVSLDRFRITVSNKEGVSTFDFRATRRISFKRSDPDNRTDDKTQRLSSLKIHFSDDGKKLLSDDFRTVLLWDVDSLIAEPLRLPVGMRKQSATLSNNGRYVAVGGSKGEVLLIDLQAGRNGAYLIPGHTNDHEEEWREPRYDMNYEERLSSIFDLTSREHVSNLKFLADNRHLVTFSEMSEKIKVWDIQAKHEHLQIRSVPIQSSRGCIIRIDEGGKCIVGTNGEICRAGDQLSRLQLPFGHRNVSSILPRLAIDFDGSRFAVSTQESNLFLLTPSSGDIAKLDYGGFGMLRSRFVRENKLAVITNSQCVDVLDITPGKLTFDKLKVDSHFGPIKVPIMPVALSNDGQFAYFQNWGRSGTLIDVSAEKSTNITAVENLTPEEREEQLLSHVNDVALSPWHHSAIFLSYYSRPPTKYYDVSVLNIDSQEIENKLRLPLPQFIQDEKDSKIHGESPMQLRIAPGRSLIAWSMGFHGSDGKGVALWDWKNQSEPTWIETGPRVVDLAFSNDGRRIATAQIRASSETTPFGNNQISVKIWDTQTRKQLLELPGGFARRAPGAFGLSFSGNGRVLAMQTHDFLNIWGADRGD